MTVVRTVHILRHAHSSWAVPGQRDHQRALDDRGREDAARLAAHLGGRGASVARVACSTAVRARQTLDIVRGALPDALDIRFDDDLYALGPAAYEAQIRAFGGPGDLLLVGHNPTIEQLVFALCTRETPALRLARPGIGTAHWLTLEIEGDALDGAMRATLQDIVRP
ncbi:histidine phosphatase family protein [Aureimonas flava]|uniref:Histidine phosphatase family protein n=1 Tax=Aureimonas flava TaxID=2320271 RepID=A0A3A1WX71_9HYPH|nr:histidine phosphatase family protein [Aureimonas flava]RIY03602.1 histidine phosphatase family protein [Aureimonas flava]